VSCGLVQVELGAGVTVPADRVAIRLGATHLRHTHTVRHVVVSNTRWYGSASGVQCLAHTIDAQDHSEGQTVSRMGVHQWHKHCATAHDWTRRGCGAQWWRAAAVAAYTMTGGVEGGQRNEIDGEDARAAELAHLHHRHTGHMTQ
jgi:hypothetical protein